MSLCLRALAAAGALCGAGTLQATEVAVCTDVGRAVLELATLKFIDAREDVLLIGPPGLGKSHCAKALAQLADLSELHGDQALARKSLKIRSCALRIGCSLWLLSGDGLRQGPRAQRDGS